MRLTYVEQREVARRAQFLLDVDHGRFGHDTAVMFGDGVEDLDRMLAVLPSILTAPWAKMSMDLGTQSSAWKPIDLEDLLAIRIFFVNFYGEVNKPDTYQERDSKAIQL